MIIWWISYVNDCTLNREELNDFTKHPGRITDYMVEYLPLSNQLTQPLLCNVTRWLSGQMPKTTTTMKNNELDLTRLTKWLVWLEFHSVTTPCHLQTHTCCWRMPLAINSLLVGYLSVENYLFVILIVRTHYGLLGCWVSNWVIQN